MAWWKVVAVLVVSAVGGLLWLIGFQAFANVLWAGVTVVTAAPLARSVWQSVAARRTGVDVLALLAMAGALIAEEFLTGAVIAIMLSGGEALDAMAQGRAERQLSRLVEGAPRRATVLVDGAIVDCSVNDVVVGDMVVVGPGELVPVDGLLLSAAVIDQSTITGESIPVSMAADDVVASGSVNAGGDLRMRATATAQESTYAGIVRLVQRAREAKAPMVRMADRVAGWFVPTALLVAGGAALLSGEPTRALAVLVVATPCPLLLATPIAMVSGMSRAARRGIIVKEGGALEALAAATTVCVDKTGTLTTGRPRVVDRATEAGFDSGEVLAMVAALEQLSTHPFAESLVAAAPGDAALAVASGVEERPGMGISGSVAGHHVSVGSSALVAAVAQPAAGSPGEGALGATLGHAKSAVHVAVDGRMAMTLTLADPLRTDARQTLGQLRQTGVTRIVLVSGDRTDVAERIGIEAGVDEILADLTPEQKVAAIRSCSAAATTVMVGDGVNDAPALAAADVGVAMGSRGATASSEVAEVVITVDSFGRIAEARRIAVRTRRIARQSAFVGMGLSAVAMLAAAIGLLAPIVGALVQEAIDVAVIINALRALRPSRS